MTTNPEQIAERAEASALDMLELLRELAGDAAAYAEAMRGNDVMRCEHRAISRRIKKAFALIQQIEGA